MFLHNIFEGSLLESSFQVARLVSGIGDLVNCDLILNRILCLSGRQPVPIDDFERHVDRMHMDGDHGFSDEYAV